jgi:hypothetical protein
VEPIFGAYGRGGGRRPRPGLGAGVLAALFLLIGCAQIESPSGGPEDRTAPRVLGMAPDSGAIGVRPETLTILFSKKMDHRTVRDWVAISPVLSIRSVEWTGERVDLILRDTPDTGRTYAVLLGAEVQDRRHNALGPWTAAFSTGSRLDTGSLRGKVRGTRLKPALAYLYAFAWSDSVPASEDDRLGALRIGQADKDGVFRLDYLPRGTPMRICALYDAARNRTFDEDDDLWASLDGPVSIDDTTRVVTDLEIYMVLPDEPGTIKGTAIDSSCVGVGADLLRRFDKEADSLSAKIGGPSVGKAAAGDSIMGFGQFVESAVDTLAVRARLAAIDSLRIPARLDSARCALPVIVRLFEKDTSLVAEVRGKGAFEFRDVVPGIYRLRAFRDGDADGQAGPGEAQGEFPHPLEVLPGRALEAVDIQLLPRP